MLRCGVVCCYVVCCSVVWCEVVYCGVVRVMWSYVLRCDMV